jgi:hypothetical protein
MEDSTGFGVGAVSSHSKREQIAAMARELWYTERVKSGTRSDEACRFPGAHQDVRAPEGE